MLTTEILFFIFGIGAILSGFMVISSTNPMHSVFSLVLTFANTSILLILLGIEFLALLFLIVYVGAIAILFLFVVMMLNIKIVELKDNATRYVPVGIIIGVIFLLEVLIIIDQQIIDAPRWQAVVGADNNTSTFSVFFQSAEDISTILYNFTNVKLIGQILYTEYFVYFLVASLILLVAMIGAIVLTLYHEGEVKRQDIFAQIASDPDKTVIKYSNKH